jgi:hypothetical protein
MDAAIASEMVLDALAVAVGSKVPIFHGIAGAGRKPVTISVRQTKVYEIPPTNFYPDVTEMIYTEQSCRQNGRSSARAKSVGVQDGTSLRKQQNAK